MSQIRVALCWALAVGGLATGEVVALAAAFDKADVVMGISSFPNPSTLGQPVSFSVLLTASWDPSTPATVTFLDGTMPLGTVETGPFEMPCGPPLPCFQSAAGFTISALSLGVHNITAAYSGDSSNNPAVSPVLVQVVSSSPIPMTSGTTKALLGLALVLSGVWLLRTKG